MTSSQLLNHGREARDASCGYFDKAHHHEHQSSNRTAHNNAHMKVSNRATETASREARTIEHPPTPIGSPSSTYPQKTRRSLLRQPPKPALVSRSYLGLPG